MDGEKVGVRKLPYDHNSRAFEVFHIFELQKGDHVVELQWLNTKEGVKLPIYEYVVYSDELVKK